MSSQVHPISNLKIKYDGSLTIAQGRSRKETQWKNKEMLWSELAKRLSHTTRTGETYEEYKKMTKSQQDQIKDVGGFVGGTLKNGRRKIDSVVWRQVLTLDADFIKGNLWAVVETLFDFSCLVYSTHKHSPSNPRLRLVIPLKRPVTPEEYQAISRKVAADLGIDFFDDTTYQPHRLMYWPSTAQDGEFVFEYQDEPWLDPDDVLKRYVDWRDSSQWPESSRLQQARQRMAEKQGDPLEKPGMVGAFCRTYSVTEAIEAFLEDKYEPAGEGRYTYKEGSTTGGLIVYDQDKFAYSHHGTDPIGGQLVNSFDLVRIHKFGLKDEDVAPGTPVTRFPSYQSMLEFTRENEHVRQTIGEERLQFAAEEFGELPEGEEETDNKWLKKLELSKQGEILSTAHNIILILQNDPRLRGKMAWNSFSHRPVIRGDMPWRKMKEGEYWGDRDDSSLRNYLETYYGITGQGKIHDGLSEVQGKNKYHPVQEYLNGLEWDGIPRLDTLLIDYLGAEDSQFVRAVTRKIFVAAVARVMTPGVKFDNVLVMVGPQGVGKSYLIKLLGQKWHSDSFSTVQGKEAYEQLQGAWLIELAELSATRKAEAEAVKHFISKQEDSYRVAYGRQISVFPRQCVFFGTTNDFTFLKDKTGNRRFWPVMVNVNEKKKNLWKDMTQFEIDQVWAEAFDAWSNNESLYLGRELEAEAIERQEQHTEESEKFGLIQEYLETPLPEAWNDWDVAKRRDYIHGTEFGDIPDGDVKRDRVCAMEIWVELFRSDPKMLNPMQAREINDILRRMPGWKPHSIGSGKLRFGSIYGIQRAFVRE